MTDKKLAKTKGRGKRQTATVGVLVISQRNCEAAGVSPAEHCALVRDWGLPHVRRGQLLLVEASIYLDELRRRAATTTTEAAPTIDDVRAALGVARR